MTTESEPLVVYMNATLALGRDARAASARRRANLPGLAALVEDALMWGLDKIEADLVSAFTEFQDGKRSREDVNGRLHVYTTFCEQFR